MLLEVETVHEFEGAWWAFALNAARRASVSALCCAMRRRFSSGVTLVSPRGCRVNGLPISNGGWVASVAPAGVPSFASSFLAALNLNLNLNLN